MERHEDDGAPAGFAARAAAWVDSAADPVVCLDPDRRVVYVNRAWGELTGRDADRTLGAAFDTVSPFGSATPEVYALMARAVDHGERTDTEIRVGERTVLAASARVDRGADGAIAGYVIAVRDVSAVRAIERALRDRETDFRTLADNSPDNIIRFGLDGVATYCNPELVERLGVAADRIVGREIRASQTNDPDQMAEYHALVMRALRTGEAGRIDMRVRVPSGEEQIHSILIRAERDEHGEIRGALAIGRDVTDLVRAQEALADKEREFRTLAENAIDNIGRWDTEGRLLYANPALQELFAAPSDELRGRRGADLLPSRFPDVAAAVERVIHEDRELRVETRFSHPANGELRVHEVQLIPEHDRSGELVSVLGIGRDVTEVVRHRDALERMARTDSLTGVANRTLLYERAGCLFDDATLRGSGVGLMLLDLDGFKNVNDRFGHRAGDELLRTVSQRLAACLRDGDLLVRLGGDEFVLVVSDVHERDALVGLADRVRLSLTEISAGEQARFARVDASIGVAVFPDDGSTIDVLLAHADLAMYQAKRNGRGRVELFHPNLAVAIERRAAIEHALVENDTAGFELHLQPVFALDDPLRVTGAEALARWQHPTLGAVSPGEFIPVAEECGRIVPVGRWVLRRAAEIAVRINRGRDEPVRIAVNVSTRQFALDDVVGALTDALASAGCDPAWIVIEITESLLLEDSQSVQRTLDALRERGVAIAIDDFGMGYSALHYLSRFPVDDLKIDRAFIEGIGRGERRTELVRAFVALADALALDVVAEGIETAEQLRFLRDIGCRHGQGYLLARPMPVDDFEAFLRDAATSPAG